MFKGFTVIFDVLDNNLQYTRKTENDVVLQHGHVLNLGKFSKDGFWTEKESDLAFSENDIWGSEHFDYRSVYDWKDVTRIAAHCRKQVHPGQFISIPVAVNSSLRHSTCLAVWSAATVIIQLAEILC